MRHTILLLCTVWCFAVLSGDEVIRRKTSQYDRAEVEWYRWAKKEDIEKRVFRNCAGWIEFDINVPKTGWYEFWQRGVVEEWTRDFFLDGKPLHCNYITDKLDRDPKQKGWSKEFNLFLTAGKHTIRLRRLTFPGQFAQEWKLVESENNPQGMLVAELENSAVRVGDKLHMSVTGGSTIATEYEILIEPFSGGKARLIGKLVFPAIDKPQTQKIVITIPEQGVFRVLAKSKNGIARPADLGNLVVAAVGTNPPAEDGKELKRTLIADIDCVKIAPYREKDGKTRIVTKPFGSYRESSGNASNLHWALDGFSYRVEIPDTANVYQLEVEYPDDDFRSIGFWTNDGVTDNWRGATLTGGVETGLQYRNTHKMLMHKAFFYPRSKELVIAALNLNQGSRAAASRIRVYRVDGPLPAAPEGIRRGRFCGNFFEEPGRWKRHFGMGSGEMHTENLKSMERWAAWNRFCGNNLMHPSIAAYNNVSYPSRILGGTGMTLSFLNETRILALLAEKYGNRFLPHITLHFAPGLNYSMGIAAKQVRVNGKNKVEVKFLNPKAKEYVAVDKNGKTAASWNPFVYNALHPAVQKKFIEIIGEIADMLADTKSFTGISMRVPLGWQFNGWNAICTANMGYGDWTIAQFEADTKIKVPGAANDPARFMKRYEFLMGPQKAAWLRWRQVRIFDYYKRILARIRQAKPDAALYVVWWGDIQSMKESGVDPDMFRSEPGFTFLANGLEYGRRYFTPLGNAKQIRRACDPESYAAAKIGDRGLSIGSSYYEVNSNLDWAALGGKKYHAFDTCAPSGVNELENYALAVANADVGLISSGGNGWIFGTPELQRPFLKEFLSLPKERFIKAAVRNDPVVFRELRTREGLWFYAVKLLDTAVKVRIGVKNAGRIISASSGRAEPAAFTLAPFMMKAFFAENRGGNAVIASAEIAYDPALKKQLAPAIAFAKKLRSALAKRRLAVELPANDIRMALSLIDEAILSFEKGELRRAKDNLRRDELVYLYDLNGHYPPGLFDSRNQIGGYPANTGAMPELVLEKIFGGDPLVHRNERCCFAETPDRIYAALQTDNGQLRLLEFDTNGRYLRSPKLTVFTEKDRNSGDSRHGFLPDPHYAFWNSIAVKNGVFCVKQRNTFLRYEMKNFRQLPSELGVRMNFPECTHHAKIAFHKGADALETPSQLKVHAGKVWFVSANRLFALDPATDRIVQIADFSRMGLRVTAFAFDRAGDLYLGSIAGKRTNKKGAHVYRARKTETGFGEPESVNGNAPLMEGWYLAPTDLQVTDDGTVLLRLGSWNKMEIHAFKDNQTKVVFDLGRRDFRQANTYGIARCADDAIVIAGGGSRKVVCYELDGHVRWERKWVPSQTNNSLPFRAPCAAAEDGVGRIWIADSASDQLICLDRKGAFLGTFGHSGTIDDRSGSGLSAPSGIAAAGNYIYVADAGNQRILKYKIK